jgi:branched-subunit amino acid aminotransferase/4-amino-4-deoxychorismate lyase
VGRVLFLDAHVARLAASARALGLTERLRIDPLAEAVRRATAEAFSTQPEATRLRVRLTLTGGDLNMLDRSGGGSGGGGGGGGARQEQSPTLLIVAQRATQYPAEMFARGVLVTIADLRVNPLDPFAGHKTLNYWPRLRALQLAGGQNAAEALVFQVSNHLAGGCVSNALVVKDGTVYTPIAQGEEAEVASGGFDMDGDDDGDAGALDDDDFGDGDEGGSRRGGPEVGMGKGAVMPSPVLPGVTRRWALDVALAESRRVERRMLTIEDVLDADEVILTNSSWGALPVARVEGRTIGSGAVGPFARQLRESWLDLTGGE